MRIKENKPYRVIHSDTKEITTKKSFDPYSKFKYNCLLSERRKTVLLSNLRSLPPRVSTWNPCLNAAYGQAKVSPDRD